MAHFVIFLNLYSNQASLTSHFSSEWLWDINAFMRAYIKITTCL